MPACEPLFREHPYDRHCEAVVTEVDERGVQLDRTVFYPTGGGQPGDTGRLTLSDGPMLKGAATAYEAALGIRKKLKGRGMPPDLWLRTKTAERIQWETYRKFCNDLCISAGTRAKASTGSKPAASRFQAFQDRKTTAAT